LSFRTILAVVVLNMSFRRLKLENGSRLDSDRFKVEISSGAKLNPRYEALAKLHAKLD
jgi:hypothetical protein